MGFEHIYFTQGVGFMSPFLFGCQFMLVNLLIYSNITKKPSVY
ncbi:hypothetical protein BRO54_0517 [Geobacillus proteiniphilus]|uniref:Uncharacterized protein n=1 Tax=Geobacillus proteiniphilus TaxID=860353 RepID=A0A1Q5T830_9BACL|nr:hypothetical protein BRO54_0517 [Geobacillus proteiniphilus]